MGNFFNKFSCNNKYRLKIILSFAAGFASVLIIPSDSLITQKLGKTLLFFLISGICYLLFELISFFTAKPQSDNYDVVEDFYNVINEERVEHTAKSTSSAGSSVGVIEKVTPVSLAVRDVVIGTFRTPEQFKFNLENNCYYTPARFVKKENLPVKYITVYEDDTDGGVCIKRGARVTGSKIVKRKSIPLPLSHNNGEEDYYYFNLEKWELLKNPIIVKDTYKGKPLFTNMFLLDNCKYSYQLLCITSPDEYKLSQKIEEIMEGDLKKDVTYRINKKFSLKFTEGMLAIVNNRGVVQYKISAADFSRRPGLMFDKIRKYIYI